MPLPIHNPTKSYWIEGADSPLRDFRSTDALPADVDVVIIGSGYAGATTAYWLHKHTEASPQKPQILLLEARDICGSSTGRNGGQLRPHAYSRYTPWSDRFGPDGAIGLIKHEMAHLPAFRELAAAEGIAEEICLKFGETFDAAMSDEAWVRLKGAYEAMKKDHGDDDEVVKVCRLIEDPKEAEDFTQMKACLGAVVHPAGQVWPYKFVHALLRIVLEAGNLNLQAHTPAESVSERDAAGWITVKTPRGDVRTKTVVHTTNRWASHLLPEFGNLIFADRATLASIKAPEGFIKHTGAQHWDKNVNNYHLQLPPPYNNIIIGGARSLLSHYPEKCYPNDEEDKQFEGVPEFFQSWPGSDVVGWLGNNPAELAKDVNEGGCWSGVDSNSVDGFPFVGAVPDHDGHFIAAGFSGHGMPRILLSTAHITPLILDDLSVKYSSPSLVVPYPSLPKPFHATAERIGLLQKIDAAAHFENFAKDSLESAKKPFCNDARSLVTSS
ncbi:FAD dependent oxidoreductase-domain-containing protein [Thelonectria olida]|uniref:FAD dependent oxidoreductase-domain-containing protein n=1 Tax=Thelonectria olida TaxID=1576542 RepID=A0A9P9ANQ7_9HYPO|nr:FAD dependent oxidoreductase-domain-containing protein [Thelonectria olida]